MRHLTFVDVTGVQALLDFARRIQARGMAVFAYNWQPQPLRLFGLIDDLYPAAGLSGESGPEPTAILRRTLGDSPSRAARARGGLPRRTVVASPPGSPAPVWHPSR